MDNIVKGIGSVNKFFGYVIAWCGAVMALVVAYEVVARYFFNAPTLWSLETNQYLFCAIVLLGGGYCLWRDSHVRVDLIYPRLPDRIQAWIDIVLSFPCMLMMCGVLIWMGGLEFWKMLVTGARSDSVIGFYLWPVWSFLPLAGVLLALQVLARYIERIKLLMGKK